MRCAATFTILLLILALCVGLWARLWLGDHLDTFRPRIEAAITEKAQIQTHIRTLDVMWHGLLPEFIMKGLELKDESGRVDLSLDQVKVRLSLLSLMNGHIDFSSLAIDRPQLSIQRRTDGRFVVAGILIPTSSDEPGIPFLDWLLNQSDLSVHDGVVNWDDQLLHSPVASFPNVELRLQGEGVRHRFKLGFTAPSDIMRAPLFFGDFHARDSQHFSDWSGTFGTSADLIDLSRFRHLLPLPDRFQTQLDQWAPQGKIESLKLKWTFGENQKSAYNVEAKFTDLSVTANQKWPGVEHLSGSIQADQTHGRVDLEGKNFVIGLNAYFDHPLSVNHIQSAAHWVNEGASTLLTIEQCKVEDPDVLGNIQGTLRLDDQGHRIAHLKGFLDRAEVSAIGRFLPNDIEPDARHWITTSLKAGHARLVTMELEGDLKRFPFATKEAGIFKVHVPVDEVQLEFAHDWPTLKGIRGDLDFDGVALKIHGYEATQGLLNAREVVGTIPNLDADHSVLDIEAKVRGPVQAGLDLISASPLKKSIGALPKLFKASGNADVGLHLHVPLDKTDNTSVLGSVGVDGAELRNEAGDIPPITGIKGRIEFTQDKVTAQNVSAKSLGGSAHANITTLTRVGSSAEVVIEAGGQFDGAEVNHFYIEDKLNILRGRGEWQGQFRVVEGSTEIDIHALTPLFGQMAAVEVHKHGSDPLNVDAQGKSTLRAVLQEFAPVLMPAAEGNLDWVVSFKRSNHSDSLSGKGHFVLLGKQGEVSLSGRPDDMVLDLSGGMDSKALERVIPRLPKTVLTGSANWKASVEERPGQVVFKLNSDLKGVGIDLPPPFGKSSSDSLPFNVRMTRAHPAASPVLSGNLDSLLGFSVAIPFGENEEIKRVAIKVGSSDSPPPPGNTAIELSGDLVSLDIDAWKKTMKAHPTAVPSKGAAIEGDPPVHFDMNILKASLGRYRLGSHHVIGQYSSAGLKFDAAGPNITGTLDWSNEGPGHINAKLDQLILRSDPLTLLGKPLAVDPSEDPRLLPILDLTANKVDFDQRQMGRVEMHAEPDVGGWKISKLTMTQAHGVLQAQGNWTLRAGQTRTSMSGEMKSQDTGLLLQDLGYPKALARGKTSLRAQLDWPGDPGDFVVTNLNGSMDLDCQSGQFLTVEPGVGRLIGLLSLQSLPRRITLDFRDIFSEGFAFDSLSGHIEVKQGVLSTRNLEMKGPAASIAISGKASVNNETADLDVKVSPAVGNSVSLASTLVGGPVVGAATYLLQRLLSNPIDQLLTYNYQVTGNWDDPQVTRVGLDTLPRSKPSNERKP